MPVTPCDTLWILPAPPKNGPRMLAKHAQAPSLEGDRGRYQ